MGWCCYEVMDVIAARKQNKKNNIVLVHWEICFRQILYLFKGNLIFPLVWWCCCEMMDVIATSLVLGKKLTRPNILSLPHHQHHKLHWWRDQKSWWGVYSWEGPRGSGRTNTPRLALGFSSDPTPTPLLLSYIRKEFHSWTTKILTQPTYVYIKKTIHINCWDFFWVHCISQKVKATRPILV